MSEIARSHDNNIIPSALAYCYDYSLKTTNPMTSLDIYPEIIADGLIIKNLGSRSCNILAFC